MAEIGVYYFPNWHVDPMFERWCGAGWTEWELLKAARPRWAGHRQPVVPEWGYFDESDPAWGAKQIEVGAACGVDAFIFDWYWYEGGAFLQRALDEGFLGAGNVSRMKFALMWANHDWMSMFPADEVNRPAVLARGAVDRAGFEAVGDYVVERYFCHPSYWRVGGKPYFSIYELGTLVKGLGSVGATREALESLREKCVKAGLGGVHLNAVVFGLHVLPSEVAVADREGLLRELGFDSATSYVWVHHYSPDEGFPQGSYAAAAEANERVWGKYRETLPVPYHPNVSMGWDPSPRTRQGVEYARRGYPWTGVLEGNTVERFEGALRKAVGFAEGNVPGNRIVTINAWNEWTEGSYLLPDTVNGMGYLEAVKRVRGKT